MTSHAELDKDCWRPAARALLNAWRGSDAENLDRALERAAEACARCDGAADGERGELLEAMRASAPSAGGAVAERLLIHLTAEPYPQMAFPPVI